MNVQPALVEKQIRLSVDRSSRLRHLAHAKALSEDQIIEKAWGILFSLTDLLDEKTDRQGWSLLSENSLHRVWDNEEDTVYDNWRELYGIPAR